jgi:hypothetical protein
MTSPFLTSREACELLRFVNKAGQVDASCLRRLYTFCTRYQVRTYSRGARSVLIYRDDLLAALQPRDIGACAPTGLTTTRPVRRFISPHGPAGDSSAGPIASFDATSTDVSSRAGSSACGNPATTLGVHPQTGRRAGNYRRVS